MDAFGEPMDYSSQLLNQSGFQMMSEDGKCRTQWFARGIKRDWLRQGINNRYEEQ